MPRVFLRHQRYHLRALAGEAAFRMASILLLRDVIYLRITISHHLHIASD